MNINIQTVHFDADEKLLDFVQKKTRKTRHFSRPNNKGRGLLKIR